MQTNTTFSASQDANVLQEIIQSLLHLIPEHVPLDHDELRAYPRYEVNWSAMLRYNDAPDWMPIFIRDISEKGVGFRHDTPLPEGLATISFFTSTDRPTVQLRVRLLWCGPAEREMYFSGSEFLGVAHDVASPWKHAGGMRFMLSFFCGCKRLHLLMRARRKWKALESMCF